ncbi:perlucin-like [Mytilus galloprovincialis]|uniref:perlucin-like n=1 Tax=Mytilus galloprovincialis TaxID=29158 RepID=UPI003F7C4ADE
MTKLLFKCLLYVSILVSVRSDCPLGFMRFQESCYAILPVKVSWAEALRLCQAFQAKLAWIDSAIEDKFIEGMLNRYHDSIATAEVWMGGTDMLIEGIWMWADSLKPFTYTNWFPGEPNNFAHGQHCLGLVRDKGFKWDDNQCELKMAPLCKATANVGNEIIG